MAKSIFALIFFLSASLSFAQSLPDFTDLVKQTSPSVVKISTKSSVTQTQQVPEIFRRYFGDQIPREYQSQPRQQQGLGSGFIISDDGFLLTNHHVVDGADEIIVRLTSGKQYKAEIIGSDADTDVAVLKIEAKGLPALEIGNSDTLEVGEWVLAIGTPFGFEYSVTAGIVSAKGRSLPSEDNAGYVPFIQTDVAINPGNSGGPLFNLDGEVVGINSQIYSRSGGFMGLSFAIPIDVAMNIADQIKENGSVDRGWLGVAMDSRFNDNPDMAEALDLESATGALISSVGKDSPAEKAGVRIQDVIIEFDGKKVKRTSDLAPIVGTLSPGTKTKMKLMRNGKELTLNVTVGSRNPKKQTAAKSDNPKSDNRLNIVVSNYDQDGQEGVLVEQVLDGPAKDAQIMVGDVITMLGGEFVSNSKEFNQIAKKLPKNKALPIRVLRNGSPTFIVIRIK